MKTKAFLLGAMIAASTAAVQAQTNPVYSVNVVGYHKRVIPNGFSMLANQVNSTNNTIASLFPSPVVGTKIYKWNGTGFDTTEYLGAPFNTWFPSGSVTLNPGEGAFIFNPSGPITNVFAGEVVGGTNALPAGFSIKSSQLPQAGTLSTQLGLPASVGDKVYRFNGVTYDTFELLGPPFNTWFPSEPVAAVGDAFWVFKGSSANWVRQFSAN